MINIVVPMAGAGRRFKDAGFDLPKPFISFNGKMMVEHVLEGLKYPNAHHTLIIQDSFLSEYQTHLAALVKNYRVAFVTVERLTQGAACTALAAHEIINNNLPVVFADADNIFYENIFAQFVDDCFNRNLDGSLLTFNSNQSNYSYAKTDEQGLVLATREKDVFSTHAIAGAYLFARGSDFVRCAINMLIYGDKAKNEFYMSNVYNYAVKEKLRIGVFDIQTNDWNCVGTPSQLQQAVKKMPLG